MVDLAYDCTFNFEKSLWHLAVLKRREVHHLLRLKLRLLLNILLYMELRWLGKRNEEHANWWT
jgi:hypothetical protein